MKWLFELLFTDAFLEINRLSARVDDLERRADREGLEHVERDAALSAFNSELNNLRNEFEAFKALVPVAPEPRVRTARNFSQFRNAAQAPRRKES